ncbi:carbon-nitrogen hydrolase family protein [Pseudomonas sp. LS1212]|uniref:carbon-nitrogen hydrolase family protein n=1 Tax=Pseudomonas sp. LS1212 TaxID=2972478 RepID=UPI00215CEBEE|nr:carbon-nitrogen hydrolase family protein [Pseudomonas sp. LS1212]UVJ42658.1 carbon-nitrogen hydrolase family protein [Pseudomonas sp. LS1212]
MRRILISLVALLAIAALCSYALWTAHRPTGHYLSDLRIQVALDEGVPADRGNLLGIEPELFPGDYQSLTRLHRKLAAYFEQARTKGLLNAKTIVVLPEHVGTWLWASGEKDELYRATQREEAMHWLALSNPVQFLTALLGAKGDDRLEDARLRMKARHMAEDYQQLFGGLAKEFGVTLVAGTIVLPEPRLDNGTLRVGGGALYNSSVVFGSDGTPLGQPQRQLYPGKNERRYIHASGEPILQVVDTPAGRLGVLIGSDSWHPANYRQLNTQAAQLIAVPAFVSGKGLWSRPWRGYTSRTAPAQSRLKPGEVSEGEAWHRLTLTGQPPASTAIAGMSVFMRGQFWDQANEGQSFGSRHGLTSSGNDGPGARLINLWL